LPALGIAAEDIEFIDFDKFCCNSRIGKRKFRLLLRVPAAYHVGVDAIAKGEAQKNYHFI
jgi:hypothetical protein